MFNKGEWQKICNADFPTIRLFMKFSNIVAAMAMFCAVSASANTNNESVAPEAALSADTIVAEDMNALDHEFTRGNADKTVYNDRVFYAEDGETVCMEAVPNCGLYIGGYAGADLFNQNITPVGGLELGWHGKHIRIAGGADFGTSKYNDESDKAGQHYLMTNFHADLGVKIANLPSHFKHQNEVWAIGSMMYKVRKNYNAFNTTKEDDKTITNTSSEFRVKGSTMAFGGGVLLNFKNYMKRTNWYVKAVAYAGQEYYFSGSEVKFGASVSIGFNFVLGKKAVNKKAIKKYFGTYDNYKSWKSSCR